MGEDQKQLIYPSKTWEQALAIEQNKPKDIALAMNIDLTQINKKINDKMKLKAMTTLRDFKNICALKIIDKQYFTGQIVNTLCETMKNQEKLLLIDLDLCTFLKISPFLTIFSKKFFPFIIYLITLIF